MSMLLSTSEAVKYILQHFTRLNDEVIPLDQVIHRVLAESIMSRYDVPLFAQSSMDGFAVIASDVQQADEHPIVLDVVDDLPEGKMSDKPLTSKQAMRIMTGALIPQGADAMVPVEDTDCEVSSSSLPSNVTIY